MESDASWQGLFVERSLFLIALLKKSHIMKGSCAKEPYFGRCGSLFQQRNFIQNAIWLADFFDHSNKNMSKQQNINIDRKGGED